MVENANGKSSYRYDMNGNRVQKVSGGKATQYLYANDRLFGEISDQGELWYRYNTYGSLVGFEYNGTTYIYQTNANNDIVGILDGTGKQIVTYQYDAWGKLLKTSGDQTIAEKNPFRYRSYYYDKETGFYYLKNRYYDPEIKRMLNMDSYVDTEFGMFSHNLYAYCENTPVNASNSSGNIPDWALKYSKSPSGKNYYWKGVENYYNSNCYGYALYDEKERQPGYLTHAGHLPVSLKTVVDYTLDDLKKLGYKRYVIEHKDVSLYDNDWNVIIARYGATSTREDYHFMKRRYDTKKGTHFWAHKPGTGKSGLNIYAGQFKNSVPWPIEAYDVDGKKWIVDKGGSYNSNLKFIVYK